jgi:uncharacterized protein DUF1579
MKIRCTFVTAAALCLLVLAVPALADSHTEKPAAAGGPSAAEMEAWQKSMTPGTEHQSLANFAGDWTYVNKAWMAPGQPPMESTGTMHGEAIFGGRYVVEDWKGEMMGQPFEGRGTTAYNNVSKQYENTWYDSMSTGIWFSTGSCDAKGVCTFTGDSWDPMSGKKASMRSVLSWEDAKTFKMLMYGPGPDGKEYQMMEIVAKKK